MEVQYRHLSKETEENHEALMEVGVLADIRTGRMVNKLQALALGKLALFSGIQVASSFTKVLRNR
jgi:hypothetical protein